MASWAGSPQHRSCCEVAVAGPLGRKVPLHRCCCEIAARPFELSCRDIALAARSPLRGLLGGVVATSLFMRDYRWAFSSWVELPRHRSSCEIAVAGSLRRSCRDSCCEIAAAGSLVPSCVDIALAAGSPPRESWTELPRHRSFCEGASAGAFWAGSPRPRFCCEAAAEGLLSELSRHRSCCEVTAAGPHGRGCRDVAIATRSPQQGLLGGVAATSLVLRCRCCASLCCLEFYF